MRSWDASNRVCGDKTLYFKLKSDHFPTLTEGLLCPNVTATKQLKLNVKWALCCFGEEIKLIMYNIHEVITQTQKYVNKQAVLRTESINRINKDEIVFSWRKCLSLESVGTTKQSGISGTWLG